MGKALPCHRGWRGRRGERRSGSSDQGPARQNSVGNAAHFRGGESGPHSLRLATGSVSPFGWTVELRPMFGDIPQTAAARKGGSFRFDGIVPGQYQLRVLDENRRALLDEALMLRQKRTGALYRRTPIEARAASAIRLSLRAATETKVPGKAMREFRKNTADLKTRRFPSVVDHLKAAISLDPEFADAHNDLGFAYVRLKQFPQSLEQFQRAVELAPNHPMANDNLCLVLTQMGRFAEAYKSRIGY